MSDNVNDFWNRKNYTEPPYKPGTIVQKVELLEEGQFVRVYNGSDTGMYGGWLMKAEDIKGLTPAQIQAKYALPFEPVYVAEVKIPVGSTINVGEANGLFGYPGGGIQIDLQGQQIGEFTELGTISEWSFK